MDNSFPLSGFGSVALHAGHSQDPMYAHVTPIYASSTFVYDEAEQGMRRFNGEVSSVRSSVRPWLAFDVANLKMNKILKFDQNFRWSHSWWFWGIYT